MSGDDKDDFEAVEEYPVFDRVTSKFEWRITPVATHRWTTYSFEVEGGDGYVLGGVRVKGTPDN